jgi:hypothetical protein
MKNLFYVLLLGVVGCAKPTLVKNNDLEKENLKGKVKSTYTEEYYVKENNGYFYFQKQTLNKEINFYNAYGLNTYTCNAEPWDKKEPKSEYTFDNQNRIKREVNNVYDLITYESDYYYTKNCISKFTVVDGITKRKYIYLYDQNRVERKYQFLQNRRSKNFYLLTLMTSRYNQDNQDSVITLYVFSDKKKDFVVNEQDKYFYDKNTHELIKHENYQMRYDYNDPAYVNSKKRKLITYKNYKFDKQGNWIERIVEENGILKGYRRKINYDV